MEGEQLPLDLQRPELIEAWDDYLQHRKERRVRVTERSAHRLQSRRLPAFG